jgi:hypothetical protein
MHIQTFDFHNSDESPSIEFPAGETLRLEFLNTPEDGERVFTVGLETSAGPLIEGTGDQFLTVSSDVLDTVPENKICKYNLWQRAGAQLDLIAEGRLIRRGSIEPQRPSTRLTAGPTSPMLLIDGDSVMQNIPGTRVFLEQMIGHKYRFPVGYLGALGGDSAQAIYESAPAMLSKIERGKTVVLVGPVGANQTTADDTFAEITTYLDAIFASYLSAGAKVVAVPTLLDGMGVTTQDAKKTALADWVSAYGTGGTVDYDGEAYMVPAHDQFFAVDVTGFDRDTMKDDVSHPNALGSAFLAEAISTVLLNLVDGDVFAETEDVNLLGAGRDFAGSRPATATGVAGTIPAHWDAIRSEGTAQWQCDYAEDGCFTISIDAAVSDSTLTLSMPAVEVNAVEGDVVSFLAEVELMPGATGLKSIGVSAQGASLMTLNPDWAMAPGVYQLRTHDLAYTSAQADQNFQIITRVAAGASLTVTFKRASAFHVGNFDTSAPVPAPSGTATWEASINTALPEQLVYSMNDRTVAATSAIDGIRNTRGAEALTGKRYFECVLGDGVLGVGVGTSAVTALSGGSFGVGRAFWSGSVFFYTGGNVGMGAALVSGDVVQIAVDVDARLIWARRNGAGDWNNSATADPATGAGGLDILGLIGDLYAYGGVNASVGASVTLSGTSEVFVFAAPTGFAPIV